MLRIGKAKPDRIIIGMMKKLADNMACCWVCA